MLPRQTSTSQIAVILNNASEIKHTIALDEYAETVNYTFTTNQWIYLAWKLLEEMRMVKASWTNSAGIPKETLVILRNVGSCIYEANPCTVTDIATGYTIPYPFISSDVDAVKWQAANVNSVNNYYDQNAKKIIDVIRQSWPKNCLSKTIADRLEQAAYYFYNADGNYDMNEMNIPLQKFLLGALKLSQQEIHLMIKRVMTNIAIYWKLEVKGGCPIEHFFEMVIEKKYKEYVELASAYSQRDLSLQKEMSKSLPSLRQKINELKTLAGLNTSVKVEIIITPAEANRKRM
jgi:hypothetical protein